MEAASAATATVGGDEEEEQSGELPTQMSYDEMLQGVPTLGGWHLPELTASGEDVMPIWDTTVEHPDHVEMLRNFRTELCSDHQRGQCSKGNGKGRALKCFYCHYESQRRRCPADPETNQIRYWDVPCSNWIPDVVGCSNGESCVFAHGRDEVSYHPAKFKTRLCNGADCRGEAICCFAHSEAEVRGWAPRRYSFSAASGGQRHSRFPRGGMSRPDDLGLVGMDGACAGAAGMEAMGGCHMGAGMSMSANMGLGGMGYGAPYYTGGGGGGCMPTRNGMQQVMDARDGSLHQAPRQKTRFCASYPHVNQCRRGAQCGFAHSREEICAPLLTVEEERGMPQAMTDAFFTSKFKTLWCPVGAQHDWQACLYAHTYQDVRRKPSIGYGPQPCPYWSKKDTRLSYVQRCPLGLRCPYSHGAKEQLYHPKYFRTVICRDMQMKGCPRQWVCAFYHRPAEQRTVCTDLVDYSKPLPKAALSKDWIAHFMSPPFFQEMNEALFPPQMAAPLQMGSPGVMMPTYPYTYHEPYAQWGQPTPEAYPSGFYSAQYASQAQMQGPGVMMPTYPYAYQEGTVAEVEGATSEEDDG